MKLIHSTDILESVTKNKNKKYWQGHVSQDGETTNYYTSSSYWQILSNGDKSIIQHSQYNFAEPTNVGRINERNSREQAFFNIESDFKSKQDEGYLVEGSDQKFDKILPMLCKTYSKKHVEKYIKNPYHSPKLDGWRLSMCDKSAQSRNGKPVIDDAIKHLLINTNGDILDGELMLPYPYTFQETCESIKKRNDNSYKLEYHIFDLIDTTMPFKDRHKYISDKYSHFPNFKIVDAIPDSLSKCDYYLNKFIDQGYEGSIIRDGNSLYEVNTRSNYLVKYKNFLDAEFEIVDVKQGTGSMEGCAIFTCKTENGTVDCVPKGTFEYKKDLYHRRNSLIGKYLTIKFQGYTDDKSLRFPVGIGIREDL